MSIVQRCFIISLFFLTTLTFSPQLLDYYHHSRFVVAGALLTIFSAYALFTESERPLSIDLIGVLIVLFAAWNFLSIIWAINSSEAYFYAHKWLIFTGMYLLCRRLLSDSKDKSTLFISKTSRILTIIIIVAVTVQMIPIIKNSGFSNDALYGLNVLLGHKSLISGYLFLLLPLNLLAYPKKVKMLDPWHLLIMGQLISIVLLQSRTVYVALFSFLMLMASYLYKVRGSIKNYRRVVVILVGVLVTAVALIQSNEELKNRLNPVSYLKAQTVSERRFVWYKTKELVLEHPWLGVGAGNWKMQFQKHGIEGSYRMQDQDVIFTRAHNDFLELWAELGFLGFLLFVLIFGIMIYGLIFRGAPHQLWQRLLLLSGVLGYLVMSFIDFPKERIEFLIIWAIYGWMVSQYVRLPTWSIDHRMSRSGWVLLGLGLFFTLSIGVARYGGEANSVSLLSAQIKGDWPGVLKHASKAQNRWHTIDPSAVPIAFYEGLAHYNMGDKEQAQVAFEAANAAHPYHFHTINNIGTMLVEESKYNAALPYFVEALRINPHFEDAIYNQAFCLSQLDRVQEALQLIEILPATSERKALFVTELKKMLE